MGTTERAVLSWVENLHLEVIEVIAKYLSTKDIVACCATSRRMRELFSNDAIWRLRCTKDLVEYLIKTPCKVEPGFVSPESENSTLSPVSKWRMSFMYENHLWNNWRQGKYKQEEIKTQKSKNFRSEFDMFLNNDIVMSTLCNRFELLDVRAFPAINATEPVHFIPRLSNNLNMKRAINDHVIALYKSFVQVYQPNFITKQCPLKHAFFFDEEQNIPVNTLNELKLLFDQTETYTFRRGLHTIVGKFFVGVIEGQSTMHIWDIDSGIKLKEQVCPLKSFKIQDIGSSPSSTNLVLTLRQDEEDSVSFLAYSLTKLTYLAFKETFQDYIQYVINNDLVAIWNNNSLNIFNYETSDLLLKDEPAQSAPKILGNRFIIHHDRKLKTFNRSTRLCEYLNLEGVDWFETLSDRFIQVGRGKELKIWEMDSTFRNIKKIALALQFNSCSFFLNDAATRYIVRYARGNVLNFW